MNDKNTVTQVRLEFKVTEPLQQVLDAVRANLSYFNACIINRRGDTIYVRITYCEEYNLLPPDVVIQHVTTAMSSISDVMVHSQIPLEAFIVQYHQMLVAVTQDICKYLHVPFDDYYQEVCMTLVRLRNEGRYIHKALLRKAAFNDCLKAFKKDIKHVKFIDEHGEQQSRQVSIYSHPDAENDTDDPGCTYAEVIEDEKAIEEFAEIDMNDYQKDLLEQVKQVCTPREFSELMRAYRSNTTCNQTNVIIRKIRRELGL